MIYFIDLVEMHCGIALSLKPGLFSNTKKQTKKHVKIDFSDLNRFIRLERSAVINDQLGSHSRLVQLWCVRTYCKALVVFSAFVLLASVTDQNRGRSISRAS